MLYDYRCDNCGFEKEALVKSSDEVVVCHKCELAMIRLITKPSNFQLKGTGWYRDGYTGKSNAK